MSSDPGPGSVAPQRVLGWDVLRGLCALAVASYHLLYWQQLASLNTLGSYGVYLFFVLSGASLAYNYSGKLARPRDAAAFLVTRWMRLAPLYIVLCCVFVVVLSLGSGRWVDRLPLRFALNASFAFGLHDPTLWALLIGGWSLGIEFVYYLAFPFLLWLLPRKPWCAFAALALAMLQWWWIERTAGSAAGYAASAVAYHQVPAFVGVFLRRLRHRALAPHACRLTRARVGHRGMGRHGGAAAGAQSRKGGRRAPGPARRDAFHCVLRRRVRQRAGARSAKALRRWPAGWATSPTAATCCIRCISSASCGTCCRA